MVFVLIVRRNNYYFIHILTNCHFTTCLLTYLLFIGTTTKSTTPSGPTTPHDKCAVSNNDKIDCGEFGTSQAQCESGGCCWEPVEPNPTNLPWCFYSTDYEDPCGNFIWTEAGPGFTDEFYNIMFEK